MAEPDQSLTNEPAKNELPKNDEEWARKLTPEQFRILRQKGTERAFTGVLNDEKRPGMFRCAGCRAELFRSDTKFDSGSGWPSFYEAIDPKAVDLHEDLSYGMVRTEVTCSRCGGHLGHVFPDGPAPTGNRFCINSASLDFDPRQ